MVLSRNREVSLVFLSRHYFVQAREDKIVKELMPLWIEMGFIVLVCLIEGFHRRSRIMCICIAEAFTGKKADIDVARHPGLIDVFTHCAAGSRAPDCRLPSHSPEKMLTSNLMSILSQFLCGFMVPHCFEAGLTNKIPLAQTSVSKKRDFME